MITTLSAPPEAKFRPTCTQMKDNVDRAAKFLMLVWWINGVCVFMCVCVCVRERERELTISTKCEAVDILSMSLESLQEFTFLHIINLNNYPRYSEVVLINMLYIHVHVHVAPRVY